MSTVTLLEGGLVVNALCLPLECDVLIAGGVIVRLLERSFKGHEERLTGTLTPALALTLTPSSHQNGPGTGSD